MKARRSKKSVSDRPKHRQERALKNRKKKAKQAASQKRSVNKIKEARKRRGKLKRAR